jgi:hypothetical protein
MTGEIRSDVALAGSTTVKLERETGFEPATPSLEGSCSSQLSYSRLVPLDPTKLHSVSAQVQSRPVRVSVFVSFDTFDPNVCLDTKVVERGGFEPPKA